jgi:hypothetical protein
MVVFSATEVAPAMIEFFRYDYCSECATELRVLEEEGPGPRRATSADLVEKFRIVKENAGTIVVDVLYPDEAPPRLQRRHIMKGWIPPHLWHAGTEFTVVMGPDAVDGFYAISPEQSDSP